MDKKFTPLEIRTIKALKKGCLIITNNEMTGALIWDDETRKEFKIGNPTFYSLVDKRIIYQLNRLPFDYVFDKDNELVNDL